MENKSEEVLRPGNQLLNDFDFETSNAISIFIFSWLVTCVCPPPHTWRSFLTTYGACPS